MNFTANHDSNSWHGSCQEFFGSVEAFKAMAVLAATLPGMPLIYGGQEGYFDKRLAFFEKDAITWRSYPLAAFYAELLALKKKHAALGNGQHGGSLQWLPNSNAQVCAFERVRGSSRVQVAVNLSAQAQRYGAAGSAPATLAPWAWTINAV